MSIVHPSAATPDCGFELGMLEGDRTTCDMHVRYYVITIYIIVVLRSTVNQILHIYNK